MIQITSKFKVCSRGHYLTLDKQKCAYCDGYNKSDWPLDIQYKKVSEKLIAVFYQGRLHPIEREAIVNGIRPDLKPPAGWFLYYMTFELSGEKLYKIGISQNPWNRLLELSPKLLHIEFFSTKEEAYKEEQRLLKYHSTWKTTKVIPKLHRKGGTEVFIKDVLNADNKS